MIDTRWSRLTPTEREIVRLRCERGMTLMEAARVRGCSDQTVKNHMSNVLTKTGFPGTNGLCFAWGYEHGLLDRVDGLRPGEV